MERYFIISVLYIYVSLSIDLYIILMHIYIYIYHVHHVPKGMSCHKAIIVITGRAHWYHDCIYMLILLL